MRPLERRTVLASVLRAVQGQRADARRKGLARVKKCLARARLRRPEEDALRQAVARELLWRIRVKRDPTIPYPFPQRVLVERVPPDGALREVLPPSWPPDCSEEVRQALARARQAVLEEAAAILRDPEQVKVDAQGEPELLWVEIDAQGRLHGLVGVFDDDSRADAGRRPPRGEVFLWRASGPDAHRRDSSPEQDVPGPAEHARGQRPRGEPQRVRLELLPSPEGLPRVRVLHRPPGVSQARLGWVIQHIRRQAGPLREPRVVELEVDAGGGVRVSEPAGKP